MENKLTKIVLTSFAAVGAAAVGAGLMTRYKKSKEARADADIDTILKDISTPVLKAYLDLDSKFPGMERQDLGLLLLEPNLGAAVLTELVMRQEEDDTDGVGSHDPKPVEPAKPVEPKPAENTEPVDPAKDAKPAVDTPVDAAEDQK